MSARIASHLEGNLKVREISLYLEGEGKNTYSVRNRVFLCKALRTATYKRYLNIILHIINTSY